MYFDVLIEIGRFYVVGFYILIECNRLIGSILCLNVFLNLRWFDFGRKKLL